MDVTFVESELYFFEPQSSLQAEQQYMEEIPYARVLLSDTPSTIVPANK